MLRLQLVFLVIFQVIRINNGDMFASISEMEKLVDTEEAFIKDFEQYIKDYEEVIQYLKSKAKYFQKEHDDMASNPEKYLANPLNCYLLIKRMTVDVDSISHAVSDLANEFLGKVEAYDETKPMPNEDDLKGSVISLERLQKMYLLNTNDLAVGVIDGEKYSEALSTHDCYEIGRFLTQEKKFDYAEDWLKYSLNRHKQSDEIEVKKVDILETMAVLYNYTERYDDVRLITPLITELDARSEIAADLTKFLDEQDMNPQEPQPQMEEEPVNRETILHGKVCRGDLTLNATELSKLKCFYVTNTTAFVKIAPIKAEQLSIVPYALVFRDVMYDSEIEVIKKLSLNQLRRSMVKANNQSDVISDSRLSKIAWLEAKSHKVVDTINQRVTDMTGLSMQTAEQLQTQNYGIGGYYNCHLDYFTHDKILNGNRIATTLFYMTTVEKGGATVFPYLKLRVPPVKGSALFWYNLKPSGHGDWMTRHSACPVLVGIKWAANKWIHEHGQEFRRPCGLQNDFTEINYQKVLDDIGI